MLVVIEETNGVETEQGILGEGLRHDGPGFSRTENYGCTTPNPKSATHCAKNRTQDGYREKRHAPGHEKDAAGVAVRMFGKKDDGGKYQESQGNCLSQTFEFIRGADKDAGIQLAHAEKHIENDEGRKELGVDDRLKLACITVTYPYSDSRGTRDS